MRKYWFLFGAMIVSSAVVGVLVWYVTQRHYIHVLEVAKEENNRYIAPLVLETMALAKVAGLKTSDPTVKKMCSLDYSIGLKRIVKYLDYNADKYSELGYPISFAVMTDEDVELLLNNDSDKELARILNKVLLRMKILYPDALYLGK